MSLRVTRLIPPMSEPQAIRVAVLIVAAGRSRRFGGGDANKVEQTLDGKPVFLHAVDLFAGRPEVARVLLAVRPEEVEAFQRRYRAPLEARGVQVCGGGEMERWQTVQRALEALGDAGGITHVAVHDGARPITPGGVIDRVFAAAATHPAVVPGVAVTDTLKRVDGGRVVGTVDRAGLVAVQTPQVFRLDLLRRAYGMLNGCDPSDAPRVTDDAALVEALSEPVAVVEGDPLNIKITTPADLNIAAALSNNNAAKPSNV